MPSTVDVLLRAVPQHGLRWAGAVRWADHPQLRGPGVYLVARTEDPTKLPPPSTPAPLASAALDQLLARCPVMADGQPASRATLAARLGSCWLPDEPVVYIGSPKLKWFSALQHACKRRQVPCRAGAPRPAPTWPAAGCVHRTTAADWFFAELGPSSIYMPFEE